MNHKEILQKANEAIQAGDREGFLSFCTEDTEWTFVGDQTLRGKEAVRQWMETAYQEPPRFTVTCLIGEGEFLTALGTIIQKDEEGRDVWFAYCDVWQFRDGKLAALQAFVLKP